MSIQGFTDTTKDADAIVEPPTKYGFLQADLETAGFGWLENEAMKPYETSPANKEVGAWDPYWRGDFTIDLFHPRRIFDKFSFTAAMKARTRPWFASGRLQLRLADASSIFLLKSITGRWRNETNRDLEDLQTLLDRGEVELDWVQEEWNRQIGTSPNPGLTAELAAEALAKLRDRGYTIAWKLRAGEERR